MMDRVQSMTISKSRLGFVLGDSQQAVDMIIASGAYPALTVIHNSVKHTIQLHEHLGDDCIIVLRMIGSEPIIDGGIAAGRRPEEIGFDWFEATRSAMAAAPFAYFQVGGPGFKSDDWVYSDYYADIIEFAMLLMHQAGYKGAVLCFYEGNPHTLSDGSGVDGWAPYRGVINRAAQYGFILGAQGYFVDGNMDMTDDWHNFRWLRVLRDYPGMFPPGTKIGKMEAGIDLRNGLGWRSSGCGADGYAAGMEKEDDVWIKTPLPRGVEFVGFAIFALHDYKGKDTCWPDFNYWEIFPRLLAHIKSLQAYETPPDEETMPTIPPYTIAIKTRSTTGQNIRAHHSLNAPIVGDLDFGEVAYIHTDEADCLGQVKTWCYIRTLDGQEGWAGAWLLMAA